MLLVDSTTRSRTSVCASCEQSAGNFSWFREEVVARFEGRCNAQPFEQDEPFGATRQVLNALMSALPGKRLARLKLAEAHEVRCAASASGNGYE